MHREALAIREAVYGTDHLDTATSYNQLGVLLDEQLQFSEAERYIKMGLEIREKHGAKPEDLAASYNNLASVLSSRGLYEQAIKYQVQAIELLEEVDGPEHPSIVKALNNLGLARANVGSTDAGEASFRRALAIHKKIAAENHPGSLTSLSNLAGLLSDTGVSLNPKLFTNRPYRCVKGLTGQTTDAVTWCARTMQVCFTRRGELIR